MRGVSFVMRVKLVVSDSRYIELEKELISKGFVIDEDAELVLTEKNLFIDHLIVKNCIDNVYTRISIDEIIFIESYGHDIQINTTEGIFKTSERLYQLERLLDPEHFLRISNSVIISRSKIKKIVPALSSKFILSMSNGQKVDVTRSYYNIFRDRLGI